MSLKDFVIIAKLGEGAYSSVYKVQRVVDNQIYALKKVKMNNLSEKQQQNALNQVRILASVKSPYIIGYKHAFIESSSLCIIMEFSDDGDLYQKIVQHQKDHTSFDQKVIWKTLVHITAGLKKLHEMNILHRDLKSANVFLSKDYGAKLGDMNVSKIAKNGLLYTQTGTPYYASPQVWKDKPYDSKSDIWSLGCVIYQMTTLKPPFRAEDMDGLYKKIIKGVYPKINEIYSKNLSSVIKSMLQVNPSNRPSAIQLFKTLISKAQQLQIALDFGQQIKSEMLQTIRVHKNLHYLTDRLPKSNYQNGYEHQNTKKMSQSTKQKQLTQASQPTNQKQKGRSNPAYQKKLNLPKLNNQGQNSHDKEQNKPMYYAPPIYKQKKQKSNIGNIDIGNMLKIQGKNSYHQVPKKQDYLNPLGKYQKGYDYQYKQQKITLQKDIKAQLRKIYNLKPSPKKKILRHNIELPRIN